MPRANKGPHLHWNSRREIWEIRWFEHGRSRTRSTGTRDRATAQGQLARHLTGEAGSLSDPAQRTIADMLSAYAQDRVGHVSAPKSILFAVDRLLEWWGDRKVSDIREGTCRAYGRHRESGGGDRRPVGTGAWGNELIVLAAAVKNDWNHGRLTQVVPVWTPQRPENRTRWLTREEVAALLRGARAGQWSEHLGLYILLGVYTGARKEAILSLRWQQIDLTRGIIDFNPPGRERTSKGRAIIQIPRRLVTFLRLAKRRAAGPLSHVIEYHGKPVSDIRKAFKLARERAGLDAEVIPHTLRHTCASWQVQAGVPLFEVAAWLGHTNIKHVQQTYGHLSPDHLSRSRNALDRRA